jgi:hypothetical protein
MAGGTASEAKVRHNDKGRCIAVRMSLFVIMRCQYRRTLAVISPCRTAARVGGWAGVAVVGRDKEQKAVKEAGALA